MGTPRRRIPTNPRPSTPPFFSRIWWARRTSVRSISVPDISCAFCCRPVFVTLFLSMRREPRYFRLLTLLESYLQGQDDTRRTVTSYADRERPQGHPATWGPSPTLFLPATDPSCRIPAHL